MQVKSHCMFRDYRNLSDTTNDAFTNDGFFKTRYGRFHSFGDR